MGPAAHKNRMPVIGKEEKARRLLTTPVAFTERGKSEVVVGSAGITQQNEAIAYRGSVAALALRATPSSSG